MRLVFVDETSDTKFKDFLGLSICTVDSRFYPRIKKAAQKILVKADWGPSVEFKGSYLFSQNSGCPAVVVEKRVQAAQDLLALNVGPKNSRMQFTFGRMSSDNHARDYLQWLPALLGKALLKAPKGAGKNLISITVDERSDISPVDINAAIAPIIESRGYILLERVSVQRSSFETIGLMYADVVGYLMGRIATISHDAELFEGLTPEQLETNGKLRKLRSSTNLIKAIKKLEVYEPL